MALGNSEKTALTVALPVRAFFVVAMPLIWLLRRSTQFVLRLFGLEEPGAEGSVHSEAELKMLVSASTERGEIAGGGQQGLACLGLAALGGFADEHLQRIDRARRD